MRCWGWRWFTVKPLSNGPCAVTILVTAITVSLYIISGSQQCDKYQFILDHPEKCLHNPFLVIIVPVAPNDVMERNAIRNTWGSEKLAEGKPVVVLFLLGLPSGRGAEIQQARIHQENLRNQDLLQADFIDMSKNVTIKTMMMLEWLRDRCPQAHYAAKVDSDILLNVKALVSMLLSPGTPQTNYLTGQVRHNNRIIRNPSNTLHDVYPPYPLGKCYIMSMDLPAKILMASKEIMPILKDDLYIGLCLKWLNIAPMDPPNPARFVFIPPKLYDRCYYSDLIAVIIYTPPQLVSLWTDINKPGPACAPMN